MKNFICIQIKKLFIIALQVVICAMVVCTDAVYADDVNSGTFTLKTGISVVDQVPNSFYGSWRVSSRLQETSSPALFREKSTDLWNLSRTGDVINLNNPFTGANASITVHYVNGMSIRFSKIGDFDGKKLTDTVEITINGDDFTGYNTLKLDTIVDGKVIKTETARYDLRGDKISGMSIIGK